MNIQEQALIELYDIASSLVSIDRGVSVKNTLQHIAQSTLKVLNATSVAIHLIGKKEDEFDEKYSGLAGAILKKKKKPQYILRTSYIAPASEKLTNESMSLHGTKAFVGLPLYVGNEIVGVMYVNYDSPQTFTDEQKMLIELFANQAAIALQKVKQIDSSRERSISTKSSCFISYSSKDENFVNKMYSDLQANQIKCWYAPVDMKIGDRIRSRIDEMIGDHDKLLLVLSKYSLISQWVEQEVESALELERKEERTILLPIRLDDAPFSWESGWVTYVRNTRNIGDFTKWKDEKSYKEAIIELLSVL